MIKNPYLNQDFLEFLQPQTNRADWIQKSLLSEGIESCVFQIGEQNHIYVKFPLSCYNPLFKIKTVLVHYDRIGIGANDNSAAVYQVIKWASRLNSQLEPHNIRIIFTDGEELGFNPEAKSFQGALGIAAIFKRLGITKDDVYTIDSCGRGEVLVISSTGKDSASKDLANRFKKLYENTIQLAKKTCKESWITIPVPYGDNAGFMALGIPAVAITLLPKDEATSYMRELQKHNKIYQNILNRDEEVSNILPETWKMMHTDQDSVENLTPESWLVMEKFLDSLANDKSLA